MHDQVGKVKNVKDNIGVNRRMGISINYQQIMWQPRYFKVIEKCKGVHAEDDNIKSIICCIFFGWITKFSKFFASSARVFGLINYIYNTATCNSMKYFIPSRLKYGNFFEELWVP